MEDVTFWMEMMTLHSSSLLGLSIVVSGSVNVVDGIGVGWFVDIIVLSNC